MVDDRDIQEDLLQEALIMLWRLDVLHRDWSDRKFRRYVFQALCNRMRSVWRVERARRVTWAPVFATRRQAQAVLRPR